jgi:hypothetical protein
MNIKASLAVTLSIALLQGASVVWAEGPREERHEEHQEHHEGHGDGHGGGRPAPPPPRAAPPRFEGHPPGAHPHGATVHPHAVRVMSPRVIRHGGERPWRHWGHAEFARPAYYWDWAIVRHVSCTAEDSYGDQYPVTEETFRGFGLINMTAVEDDALDRCYAESGGDQTCYLATCSHF